MHTERGIPLLIKFAAIILVGDVLLVPRPALATHVEPVAGKKMVFSLVNGFIPCGEPNTAMQTNGFLACTPTGPVGFCTMSSAGKGTLTLVVTGSAADGTQDVKVKAVATGLACEGAALHVRLSLRVTSDDCPEGSCTSVDVQDFDLNDAFCTVENGKCKIKTTLSTALPGLFTNGKNTGVVVLGCGLKEFGCPPCPADLPCGILLK